ncbi:MAG: SLC13/DASS family transporter [Phycisphaerae bacterium]|nr:SLC13/DASS family transporter [Phycisphaerae bacterium]
MPDLSASTTRSSFRAWLPLVAGPCAAVLALAMTRALAPEAPSAAVHAAAVLAWMAVWWLTEAVPLAVTSLLPLVLFPLLGVSTGKEAAAPYADRIIFLYVGGFFIAMAMERWGLHRRIALTTLLVVGAGTHRLVGGVMLVTGIISMWVSNTATAMMMLPIAISLIDRMERHTGKTAGNFALCMLLAVAYGANIGGIGTPIGTPPNAIMLAFVEQRYGMQIEFLQWAMVGIPFALTLMVVAWLYLTRFAYPIAERALPGGRDEIRAELASLGPMSRGERSVLIVFLVTVAGWMLREPVARLLPAAIGNWVSTSIDDTTVALVGGLVLFAIPVDLRSRTFVMDWSAVARLPWDILFLFGGGLSLAAGVQSSGLADLLGNALAATHSWPLVLTLLLLLTASVFLSEVTSNTAQANLFMPILAGLALAAGVAPLTIIAPCTIAFSCAFMLPMGTPPNAIVFGSGRVTIRQMARAGLGLNFLGIALILASAYTLIPWVLPVIASP